MKIKTWHEGMSDKETADLAYWERNMLALRYAEGWYYDDIEVPLDLSQEARDLLPEWITRPARGPRYRGWCRILSLEGGKITFHIPDDFDVGNLPEIAPNWDGHTTEEKWRRVLTDRGIHK